jgi:hypothetical protein
VNQKLTDARVVEQAVGAAIEAGFELFVHC